MTPLLEVLFAVALTASTVAILGIAAAIWVHTWNEIKGKDRS